MVSPICYILFKIFAHPNLKKQPPLPHIAEEHVKTQYRIIGYVLYKLSCGSHTTPREIGFELFGMGSIENIIKTAPILQFIDWIKDDGQPLTTDNKLILKEEIYKDKELLSKVIEEIDFWNRDAFGRYAGLPDSYCVID